MTDPLQTSSEDRGGSAEGQELHQDPWGVKRVENLITSLQGVMSARIVVTPVGEVSEIHVLTQGGMVAKQVVRNVESALLAHLGLRVDHRKISVAQTTEVRPLEALEQSAVRTKAARRGVLFEGLEVRASRSNRVKVAVTVSVDEEEFSSEGESANTPQGRLQASARACAACVNQITPEPGTVELVGVEQIDAFGSSFAFVALTVVEGRQSFTVTGSCEFQGSPEQAAALAVLDATNRWIHSRLM